MPNFKRFSSVLSWTTFFNVLFSAGALVSFASGSVWGGSVFLSFVVIERLSLYFVLKNLLNTIQNPAATLDKAADFLAELMSRVDLG